MFKILEGSQGLIIVNYHILVKFVVLVVHNKKVALHFGRDAFWTKCCDYLTGLLKFSQRSLSVYFF